MCVEKVSKAFYGDYVHDILQWGIGCGGGGCVCGLAAIAKGKESCVMLKAS